MENSWKTFGYGPIKQILDLQVKAGQLAHAYFFAGPEGLGKKTLALEFAEKILDSEQFEKPSLSRFDRVISPQRGREIMNIAAHPDFLLLDESEEIKMEIVQVFMERLSFKPFLGKRKVAIINNADLLNTQSANALLKTLEEPSESTIIILIASSEFVLPTILSRCQVFTFSPLSSHDMEEFAVRQKLSESREALAASFGRPGRFMKLAENSELLRKQRERIIQLQTLQNLPAVQRLSAISDLADLETGELQTVITDWILWLRQQLPQQPQVFCAIQHLLAALQQLRTNKNKKLILQGLFLAM